MRVIVFGATGKTGQHVVRAALAAGHRVTAFGRSIERIKIDAPALVAHKGDVFDADSAASAVADTMPRSSASAAPACATRPLSPPAPQQSSMPCSPTTSSDSW